MSTERYPLVRMQSKTNPKEAALSALKRADFKSFCLVLDSLDRAGEPFPLPEPHWINQPVEDDDPKTMLMLALLEVEDVQFCRKLVEAGADANLFSVTLGMAPLHYAVLAGSADKVRILLETSGNCADADLQTQDGAQSPLHLAAEAGLGDILDVLLESAVKTPNVDARDAFGVTPLFVAAREGHEACVRALLAAGANLQFRGGSDNRSVTELIRENLPHLDLANKTLYAPKPLVRKTPEDLDEYMKTDNVALFKYSLKYVSLEALSKTVIGNRTLLQRACETGRHEFVEMLLNSGVDPNFSKAKSSRPVLFAAEKAHPLVLAKLKQASLKSNGTRFDLWHESTQETVLHMVLKKESLRALAGGIGTPEQIRDYEKRYSDCLDVLLSRENDSYNKQIRLIINKLDDRGNTPLHYATTAGWSQSVVRKLLDLGANIGVKNWRGEIPLTRINPQTLSDFLDEECLKGTTEISPNEDFPIVINYSFLAPPVTEDQLKIWDAEQQAEIERKALPETNCVWHMSNSPTHRHLVTHPVVKSFLWLKWQRIRRFFNLNLRFYSLFVGLLTWYIFARFAGHEWTNRVIFTKPGINESTPGNVTVEFCSDILWGESRQRVGFWYGIFVLQSIAQGVFMFREYLKETNFCTSCKCNYSSVFAGWIDLSMAAIMCLVLWGASGILWLALSSLVGLMFCRELLQMTSSLKRYWTSIENWVETALIGIVLFIIYFPDDGLESSCSIKRCLSAFAILLSWAELITMVGRHPHLSLYNKYVTMFYKVLRSFFSFLVWYSFFLVAFGLGFYIMLHSDGAPKAQKEDEEENEFFQNPWLSLVKTSTMFIGELEFSDIHIYKEASTSAKVLGYIFLLLFVFLIVVVLMNLLNGLAVSDTAGIEREANIICHISKAETISYAESVLLGDPFDFLDDNNSSGCNPFKGSSFCSYFRNLAQKMIGATGILLFYTYLTEKKVEFPLDHGHFDDGSCLRDSDCCRSIRMAKSMQLDAEYRDILFEARKIISRCSEQFKEQDYISTITEMLQQVLADQKLMTATIFKQSEEIAALRKTLKM